MGYELVLVLLKLLFVFLCGFGGYLVDKHINDKRRDVIKELTKDKKYLQDQIDMLKCQKDK